MPATHPTFDLTQWMEPGLRAEFLGRLRPKRYSAGQLIYAQGDAGREMYRVTTGTVRLSVAASDGREVVFLLFGPGDCFGESSLVDGRSRPQTAEALTDLELGVLDHSAYGALRAATRQFDDALLRLLAAQMRFASERYAELSLANLPARVAARIFEAAQQAETASAQSEVLVIKLPQAEIASLVGASRQAVNRILKRFEARGLIETEYNSVIIHDLEGVRLLALAR